MGFTGRSRLARRCERSCTHAKSIATTEAHLSPLRYGRPAMKNLTTLLALATIATGAVTIARADATPRSSHRRPCDSRTSTRRTPRAPPSCSGGPTARPKMSAGIWSWICALALVHPYAACVHTALSNAIATINRPAVTAYAAQRGIFPDGIHSQDRAWPLRTADHGSGASSAGSATPASTKSHHAYTLSP